MPRALDYVRRAFEMPPRQAAHAAAELAAARWSHLRQRIALTLGDGALDDDAFARRLGIGDAHAREAAAAALFRHADSILPVEWSDGTDGLAAARIMSAATDAIDHRFDLLGSGPVRVTYDLVAPGLDGHCYRMVREPGAAARQRARMEALLAGAAESYTPIDWHVDFRSGYRWPETEWSSRTAIGHLPGVDVKMPWELSRFQHAGVLGLSWRIDPEGPQGSRAPAEFRAQVVDWIAANPFGRGPNWACAMDVALRAVGWLTGTALLNDAPALTPAFRWLMARSLHAHGRHIEAHLEYHRAQSGNHYLSDIVGLLCIGAALPELPESPRWCLYGIQELVSEMERQVLPDGGDIEGSVPYHHLVAELFLLGTLAAVRLPPERRRALHAVRTGRTRSPLAPRIRPLHRQAFDPTREEVFPAWYLDRLLRMAELSHAVTKPNGRIPLIGDNDNGRAFRISPAAPMAWRPDGEDPADRRIVAAAASLLFDSPHLATRAGSAKADAALLVGTAPTLARSVLASRSAAPPPHRRFEEAGSSLDLYPETGLAIARAGPLYLAISFGTVPATSSGGHFHNDLLAFELQWDGIDFVVDAGTWVYTPLPDMRDAFRSTRAHGTIIVGDREQRAWPEGAGRLFAVKTDAAVEILEASHCEFAAEVTYDGVHHVRRFHWTSHSVRISDEVGANEPAALRLNFHPATRILPPSDVRADGCSVVLEQADRRAGIELTGVSHVQTVEGWYSPGYGSRIASPVLVAALDGTAAATHIAFTHAARAAAVRPAQSEEIAS